MVWAVCALLAAAFALTTGSHDYLLPGDVQPLHYDVRVIYDLDPTTNFTYYGCVDILLTATKKTSKIVLHAESYSIPEDGVSLSGPTDDMLKVKSFKVNDTFNFLTVELDAALEPKLNYTLSIPFYGNLSNGLDGVYISNYVDKENNVTEYLIATQFEAISARKGFPCFDEPMYKATFSINVGHLKEYSAVSNMPLYNSTEDNVLEDPWPWTEIQKTFQKSQSAFVWDRFEKSVPMSTYLVAFVVSKFSYVESPTGLSSTAFRIWARRDAIDQTSYAASIGPKVLSHFENFFNVSFPLPKQDMIAIPDFSAGAMENWGLITYRETALLYDKVESSFVNKERVAEVIAHELAHQWFGNLVTMKWWSDLWLNEGFATFVASIGVNAVEHTWNADRNYAVDNILSVLNLDSLESSHPVSTKLDHPKRINEIFDEISYRKGATLIRMMTMFLGQDVFRRALHNYLIKHSYSNAAQDDLWSELTATSQQYGGLTRNVSVKEVMDTWTTQTGYPLLTVTRDYSDNTLTVTQKRYLNIGAKSTTCVSWWVPLSVMCETEVGRPIEPVQWLANTEGVENKHRFEHSASANEWVLFNYDMIAPYRVNYDTRNWQLLIKTLSSARFGDIPVLGRVQLLSDAFALAWSEQLDYSTALDLSNYLQRETEYLPLNTGMRALGKIENVLKRTAEYGAFQKFLRQIIGEQYVQAGGLSKKTIVNGDDLNSVKMQVMTSAWACKAKVPGCEENAIELFRRWMDEADPDHNNPIPLDLRSTVYCVAIKRGSVREWRFMLERKRRANVAVAREAALSALTCTSEVWILTQYLEWAITDNTDIRRQDSGRVISGVTGSTVGYYVARDFIYTRIKDIYEAFHGQGRRMGIIIKTLLMQFTTQRELDEFLAWREINNKYLEDAQLAVSQGIEAAKVNIAWLNRNKKLVSEKFREYSSRLEFDKFLLNFRLRDANVEGTNYELAVMSPAVEQPVPLFKNDEKFLKKRKIGFSYKWDLEKPLGIFYRFKRGFSKSVHPITYTQSEISIPEPAKESVWKGFHPGYLHSILAIHNISGLSTVGLDDQWSDE